MMVEPNEHDRFFLRQRIRPVVNQYEFSLAEGEPPFCFVEQKRFKFKEDIGFFADDTKTVELMRLKARQRFYPAARYDVTEPGGAQRIGQIQKQFGSSLLRSTYTLYDALGNETATVPLVWPTSASGTQGSVPSVPLPRFARTAEAVLKPAPPWPTTSAMDPIAATSSTTANVPSTAKAKAVDRTRAFEDKLKAAGAKLEKVHGHAYERVTGGKHDGKLLNTSGNERSGQLFQIVHRHGRAFHVYGSGSHRLFVGMPPKTGGTQAAS